jgi:hypothetical protein
MREALGDDWFLIEGTIEHFQWTEGHENLAEQIAQRARTKGNIASAAATALDMYGALATSAMVAMYDGEPTENFAFGMGGEVVCGSFAGARKLRNGDQIRAIVSREDNGVLYARAIQRARDELVWLPNQVYCGNRAALKRDIKMAIHGSIFAWIGFLAITMGLVIFKDLRLIHASLFMLICVPLIPLFAFAVEFLPGRIGKEFGMIGSRIFTMFDFRDPDNLNMIRANFERQTAERDTGDIYMYGLAQDAHAKGGEILTKFDREMNQIAAQNGRKIAHRSALRKSKNKSAK